MSSFIVWPSEAVLIGMFLEEYLQARQCYDRTSVLDFIDSHLRSFVPDMTKYSTPAVAEDELPPDVNWISESQDELPPDACWKGESEVAISLSTQRVFFKSGDAIREHMIVDSTRKSLADLVRSLVFPYAGKSLFDEAPCLPAEFQYLTDLTEWDLRKFTNKLHQTKQSLTSWTGDPQEAHEFEQGVEAISSWVEVLKKWVERREVDDAQAIEREVVRLIAENDLTPLFCLGRIFGRVLADCHRCDCCWISLWPEEEAVRRREIDWGEWYMQPYQFFASYDKNLNELRGKSEIKSLSYAPLVIDRELARSASDKIGIGEGTPRAGLARTAQIRMLVGMIASELIASLRDADKEASQRDAASGTPREVAMPPAARSDSVLGPVSVIWDEFRKLSATGLPPNVMVRMIGHTIETEVRSVWPDEFKQQGHRANFGKVLDDKAARATCKLERRFARHAQHLYKQRVIGEHHLGDFSFLEALYFMYGIRVLDQLAEQIKKAREEGRP